MDPVWGHEWPRCELFRTDADLHPLTGEGPGDRLDCNDDEPSAPVCSEGQRLDTAYELVRGHRRLTRRGPAQHAV